MNVIDTACLGKVSGGTTAFEIEYIRKALDGNVTFVQRDNTASQMALMQQSLKNQSMAIMLNTWFGAHTPIPPLIVAVDFPKGMNH